MASNVEDIWRLLHPFKYAILIQALYSSVADVLLESSALARFLSWLGLHNIQDITSQQLNDVLNRDWIHRLWTLQEIALAKNAEVICGTKRLGWSQFVLSIVFLYY